MKYLQQGTDIVLIGVLSLLVGESILSLVNFTMPIHISAVTGFIFVLCTLIAILSATNIVQGFTSLTSVVAEGESMIPTFPSGLVFVYAYETDDIRVGDIIIFEMADGTVVHRVFEDRNSTVVTKGDNNEETDERVPSDNIRAKIVTIRNQPLYIPISQESRFELVKLTAARMKRILTN